ncbi:MAG TPA: cytochrome P450 [Thermoleophilaceae bacterium]|jgi:cytochrome P450
MEARDVARSRAPAVVNALGYAVDPIRYIRWVSRRSGPVTSPRFPGFPLIVSVSDPELARQVFMGDPSTFHSGESSKAVLEPTVGANSVLTLDDEPHMRQRKRLLKPFHGENVTRWEATIRSIAEQDMASWPVGKPFALHERTRAITLEVILRAAFGVSERARIDRARALIMEFADRARAISIFSFVRRDFGPLSPWARFKRARDALDAFLYEEIDRRRVEPDLAERDDVLSMLLCASDEAGEPLSRQELRDELVTVLGAGHETTATALAWAFERVLRTPRVLDRLRQSLAEGDEYLEATIKETLRIRPPAITVTRKVTRETELGGYRIPAGALVMPAIAGIHFREDLYPEPDEFRPERFLGSTPGGGIWIPFGGGVRRCVGSAFAQFEIRVVMRTILERAQLRAASARPERSKLRIALAVPSRGCRVVLERPVTTERSLAGTPEPARIAG